MAKYTREVKAQAVAAAKTGMSLKAIQTTIGPNPKAVMRYLAAEGIEYKTLKEQLKADGKLEPAIKKNKSFKEKDDKAKAKKAKAASKTVQAEEIIEE